MSKSRLLAGVALAALCLPVAALSPVLPFGASQVQAQSVNVSFQLFFDQLQPHGVWVQNARYQYVFCPTGVDADWRPYTKGRWLYLEGRGWYFASDEPFAWATYHYGRWFADQKLGWCWVPGTKWAPAWVSWRRSNDVVGWAPLPPEQDGYAVSVEVSRRDLPEGYWVFVPTRSFVEPDLSVNIIIGSAEPQYYAQTEFLGPVVIEGDVVVNNVIDVTYIEQNINQQVIVYQPQEAASPADQTVSADSQAIAVFDQDVPEANTEATPPDAVDETQAVETITSQGGTAGATAEIAAEGDAEATPADATTQAVDAEAGAAVEAEAEAGASTTSDGAATEAEAPAAPAEEAAPAADTAAPASDAAAPAENLDQPCPPETQVDGKCPVTEPEAAPAPEAPATAPAEEAPAPEATPSEQPAAPAAEAEPAPEAAAPAPEAAAPAPEGDAPAPEATAPAEEAAPAPDATPAEEAAPAPEAQPGGELPCPPEARVDGKCPPQS